MGVVDYDPIKVRARCPARFDGYRAMADMRWPEASEYARKILQAGRLAVRIDVAERGILENFSMQPYCRPAIINLTGQSDITSAASLSPKLWLFCLVTTAGGAYIVGWPNPIMFPARVESAILMVQKMSFTPPLPWRWRRTARADSAICPCSSSPECMVVGGAPCQAGTNKP